jgi:hypothetical protein
MGSQKVRKTVVCQKKEKPRKCSFSKEREEGLEM